MRYYKKDKISIATPENALLDELYFMAKKLRNIQLKDLIFKTIDRKKLCELSKRYKFIPFHNLLADLKIC